MSLPTLADPSDLERWLSKDFTSDEWARADQLLEMVSALVRVEGGATWVDEDGELFEVPDWVPGLVVAVAARIWDNPTFKSQRTIGPFSDSWGSQVGLFLTEDEKASIPGGGSGGPKAFTINTIAIAADESALYGALVNGPDGWAPGEQW